MSIGKGSGRTGVERKSRREEKEEPVTLLQMEARLKEAEEEFRGKSSPARGAGDGVNARGCVGEEDA